MINPAMQQDGILGTMPVSNATGWLRRALRLASWMVAVGALLSVTPVMALNFTFDSPIGGQSIDGLLDTAITVGVGMRMQGASGALIAKSNLNPSVCAPPYQSCQGLFRTQTYPAEHLVAAPGAASSNGDAGDLNYRKKYDLFAAPLKVSQELKLSSGKFGFFAHWLYFYDLVNDNFNEYHPNEITPQNVGQVGRVGSTVPVAALSSIVGALPPGLQLNQLAVTGRFYGPGGVVQNKRSDHEVLREIGTKLQFLETYVYGSVPLFDQNLTIKLGRQLVNWGESTTLQINSINNANPINANNFYRIGRTTQEVFIPVNMIDLGYSPFENFSTEAYYQLEWKSDEAPTPGSYFSDTNIGTSNAVDNLNAGFGGGAEDPACVGKLLDNPLSGLTADCQTISRVPDAKPRTSGQYGIKLDYFAANLSGGTDFSFYFENYHSRLPYLNLYAAYPSCLRAEGNQFHNNATDITSTLTDCPNIPLLTVGDPTKAMSDALDIDTIKFQLGYPEDIHMFGLSFNTTVGSYSLQGEVAYRPNKPMQVDAHDLAFAALGHSGTACGQPGVNCQGTGTGAASVGGSGNAANGGSQTYPGSDAVDRNGNITSKDTYNLVIGDAAGSQRYFPNFVIPYRGGVVGQNPACYPALGSAEDKQFGFNNFSHPYYAYNSSSPCFIRGYERMQDFEFNLGATRVYGETDNFIGADQIILLYELGAEVVPNMPSYDQLVLQAPGVNYGPTAGADGSGADGSRMGCSNIPDCSYGPDGLRFNPHQQDHSAYPDKISWGYRIVALLDYEQPVPGITLKPLIIWSQDMSGTSPGPAGNFIAGRKSVDTLFNILYHQGLSLNLGYTWYFGGGIYNTLSDRDYAQAYVRYQF
ncbi:MAG: DUF1302 family protein [Stenotrophobium sp.]